MARINARARVDGSCCALFSLAFFNLSYVLQKRIQVIQYGKKTSGQTVRPPRCQLQNEPRRAMVKSGFPGSSGFSMKAWTYL